MTAANGRDHSKTVPNQRGLDPEPTIFPGNFGLARPRQNVEISKCWQLASLDDRIITAPRERPMPLLEPRPACRVCCATLQE